MEKTFVITKKEKRKMIRNLVVRISIAIAIFVTAYIKHGLAYTLHLAEGGAISIAAGMLLCYALVFGANTLDYGLAETIEAMRPSWYFRNFLWEMLFGMCPDDFEPNTCDSP